MRFPKTTRFFLREAAELAEGGGELTKDRVLGYLDLALRKSLNADVHTAPARYIELAGRHVGLWGGKGAPVGKHEPSAPEKRDMSPAEIHGLPEQRSDER
jgi:hypothetical protein